MVNNWFPFFLLAFYARVSESKGAMGRWALGSRGRRAMTKFVSRSLGLFVTVFMLTLSFGCGEDLGETGTQSAELSNGECNSIVARALSAAQRCARGDCGFDECVEVGEAFQGFFGNEDCAAGFASGDINGLPENASIHPQTGAIKHIGEVICGSVVFCGFCEGAPEGVCTGPCEEAQ